MEAAAAGKQGVMDFVLDAEHPQEPWRNPGGHNCVERSLSDDKDVCAER